MAAFTYTVVASALHDDAAVDRIVAPVEARLRELDGARTGDPAAYPQLPYAVLVATGGTEAQVLATIAARQAAVPWEPVVLLAHRWHNSLPAALESLARVRLDGRRGRIVQVDTGDELPTHVEDLAALHRLRRARLGLVGTPSEWLVASVPDRGAVRERWGIELVDVDIADTIAGHGQADPAATRAVAVKFSRRRPGHDGMPSDTDADTDTDTIAEPTAGQPGVAPEPAVETVVAAAVHPALAATIARAGVDAVTVRCFDFLGQLRTSGCVALAELNDTGVVAGCEGDVAGAVAMLLAREVLGSASWIANPAVVEDDAGRMMLAHCTVAPSLVDDLELHTHFESGLGIGLRGRFRPGPVTLLRLGGRRLEQRWIVDATILDTGASSDLCRTQVTLAVEPARLTELLEHPLGNHVVMVPGHHTARLERWWRLALG